MAASAAISADQKPASLPPIATEASNPPDLPATAEVTRKLWEQVQASIPKLTTLRTIEGAQEIEEGVHLLECALQNLLTRQTRAGTKEERSTALRGTQEFYSSIHIAQNACIIASRADEIAKAAVKKADTSLTEALKASRLAQGNSEVKALLETFNLRPHLLISPWLCRRYEELLADKDKLSLEEKDVKLRAYRAFWNVIAEAAQFERTTLREETALARRFVCHFTAINEREGAVDLLAGKFHPVGILHNLLTETRNLAKDIKQPTVTEEMIADLKQRAALIVQTFNSQAEILKAICEQTQTLDTTHFFTSSAIHFPTYAQAQAIPFDALDPVKLKADFKKIWEPMRDKARQWRTQLAQEFNECRQVLRQREAEMEIEKLTASFGSHIADLKVELGNQKELAARLRTALDASLEIYKNLDKREAAKSWFESESTEYILLTASSKSSLKSQLAKLHSQILQKYDECRSGLKKKFQEDVIAFWKRMISIDFSERADKIDAQRNALSEALGQLPAQITDCIAEQHKAIDAKTVNKEQLAKKLSGSDEESPFKPRFELIAKARLELETPLAAFNAPMPIQISDTLFDSNLQPVWTEVSKTYCDRKVTWTKDKKTLDILIWEMAENLNRLEYVSLNGVFPVKSVHNFTQLHQGTASVVGYCTTYTRIFYGMA